MNNLAVIDTLRYSDRLKDAGIPADQAEAMSRALNDEMTSGLATKADIDKLDGRVESVEVKLDALDAKVDALGTKVDAVDAKLNTMGRYVFLVLALLVALGFYNVVALSLGANSPPTVAAETTAVPAPPQAGRPPTGQ